MWKRWIEAHGLRNLLLRIDRKTLVSGKRVNVAPVLARGLDLNSGLRRKPVNLGRIIEGYRGILDFRSHGAQPDIVHPRLEAQLRNFAMPPVSGSIQAVPDEVQWILPPAHGQTRREYGCLECA